MDHDADHIFDSTVLSAFCLVERLDLLAEQFGGRAHWTIEVYDEVARGIADTPRLSKILTAAWLGEPVRSFAVADIERIRLALGGKPRDRRHLGEAATIAAARTGGYVVAVDDYDATRYATAQGLSTTTTIALLRDSVRAGRLTPIEAKALCDSMIDTHDRRLPRVDITDLT